jgi:hypothetical protein
VGLGLPGQVAGLAVQAEGVAQLGVGVIDAAQLGVGVGEKAVCEGLRGGIG